LSAVCSPLHMGLVDLSYVACNYHPNNPATSGVNHSAALAPPCTCPARPARHPEPLLECGLRPEKKPSLSSRLTPLCGLSLDVESPTGRSSRYPLPSRQLDNTLNLLLQLQPSVESPSWLKRRSRQGRRLTTCA
jgi:hypothetical protein